MDAGAHDADGRTVGNGRELPGWADPRSPHRNLLVGEQVEQQLRRIGNIPCLPGRLGLCLGALQNTPIPGAALQPQAPAGANRVWP